MDRKHLPVLLAGSIKRPLHSAFSLIELLLVMVIISILGVLVGSRFNTSSRQRGMNDCRHNLQKIYLAMSFYVADNKGQFPMVTNATSSEAPLSLLIPKCTTVTEMFICPGSHDRALSEGVSFSNDVISYAYYMGRNTNADPSAILLSDRQFDTLPKLAGRQAFSIDGKQPGHNHDKDGGNLLFVNGEAISTKPKASRDLIFPTNVIFLNPRP